MVNLSRFDVFGAHKCLKGLGGGGKSLHHRSARCVTWHQASGHLIGRLCRGASPRLPVGCERRRLGYSLSFGVGASSALKGTSGGRWFERGAEVGGRRGFGVAGWCRVGGVTWHQAVNGEMNQEMLLPGTNRLAHQPSGCASGGIGWSIFPDSTSLGHVSA
jgi:hypothetical protein